MQVPLKELVPAVLDTDRGTQPLAVEFQEKFGQAGDSDASSAYWATSP